MKRRRTKSGKKRFFIKKQNKVSNLDDQFEEVVSFKREERKKRLAKKVSLPFHERIGKITSLLLLHERRVKSIQRHFKVLNLKDLYSTIEILL